MRKIRKENREKVFNNMKKEIMKASKITNIDQEAVKAFYNFLTKVRDNENGKLLYIPISEEGNGYFIGSGIKSSNASLTPLQVGEMIKKETSLFNFIDDEKVGSMLISFINNLIYVSEGRCVYFNTIKFSDSKIYASERLKGTIVVYYEKGEALESDLEITTEV